MIQFVILLTYMISTFFSNSFASVAEGNKKILFTCSMNTAINTQTCRNGMMAFNYALKEYEIDHGIIDFSTSEDTENSFSVINTAADAVKKGYPLIVSSTSYADNNLICRTLQNKKIVSLFAHSVSDAINNGEYANMFSVVPPLHGFFEVITRDFIEKGKRYAMVYNSHDPHMFRNHLDKLRSESLNRDGVEPNFDIINIAKMDESGMEKFINDITSKKYGTVFVSSYWGFLADLHQRLKDFDDGTPIVFTASVTEQDMKAYSFKNRKLVSGGFWVKGMKGGEKFEKTLKRLSGSDAKLEFTNGYDVGVIVANIIKKLGKENITYDKIMSFLKESPCFDGTSRGKICLRVGGGQESYSKPLPVVFDKQKNGLKIYQNE